MWNVPLRVGVVASLVVLSVPAEARTKDREVSGSQQIVVAVFNRAGAPMETVLGAEVIAAKIYEPDGLFIAWKNCTTKEQPNLERCGAADNPGELVLNIEHQGQTGTADAYGVAFLGKDGRGKFCDVFYDRILELHHSSRASEETILGIVAAHELGHLLLGLGSHSNTGIMRPQIRCANFLAPVFGFQITPQQLQKIRERQRQVSIVNESQ